jgi:enoyl-CoA hydratase/carnithine racemase
VSLSNETPVRTDLDDGILTVTLDRPGSRNALDPAMRDALAEVVDETARSAAIRALVIASMN